VISSKSSPVPGNATHVREPSFGRRAGSRVGTAIGTQPGGGRVGGADFGAAGSLGALRADRRPATRARAARAARGPDPRSSCRATRAARDPGVGRGPAGTRGSRRSPASRARPRCAEMQPGRGGTGSREKGFRRRGARSLVASMRGKRAGRPRSGASDANGRVLMMAARAAAAATPSGRTRAVDGRQQ